MCHVTPTVVQICVLHAEKTVLQSCDPTDKPTGEHLAVTSVEETHGWIQHWTNAQSKRHPRFPKGTFKVEVKQKGARQMTVDQPHEDRRLFIQGASLFESCQLRHCWWHRTDRVRKPGQEDFKSFPSPFCSHLIAAWQRTQRNWNVTNPCCGSWQQWRHRADRHLNHQHLHLPCTRVTTSPGHNAATANCGTVAVQWEIIRFLDIVFFHHGVQKTFQMNKKWTWSKAICMWCCRSVLSQLFFQELFCSGEEKHWNKWHWNCWCSVGMLHRGERFSDVSHKSQVIGDQP